MDRVHADIVFAQEFSGNYVPVSLSCWKVDALPDLPELVLFNIRQLRALKGYCSAKISTAWLLTLLLYQYKPYSLCQERVEMICCWVSFAPCSQVSQVCCLKPYRISMDVCNYRHPQDSMRTQEEIYQTCNCCLYAYLLKPVVLLWCNILATNNFQSGSVLSQSD